MSKINIQFAAQRLREEEIDETSATPGEGAYLTKPRAKRNTPKPTSGYKEVSGFRPGHSNLKVVQTKDLWNMNEAQTPEDEKKLRAILPLIQGNTELYNVFLGMMKDPYPHGYDEFYKMLPQEIRNQAPEPEEISQSTPTWSQKIKSFFRNENLSEVGNKSKSEDKLTYKTGEYIKVGDSVTTDKGDTGKVTGFQKASKDDEETVFITVTKQKNGGSVPVPNTGLFSNQLTLNNPKSEPIKEGIKRDIKNRNPSQQFHEAARMVNRKLQEINSILEYAAQIKGKLDESSRPNHLMEKMKKKTVSAYNKMRKL
jgi:hypothetical protein